MLQSARRAFVLIAALATPLAPAFAQAPLTAVPPAARPLDPADLAVAGQIIAITLPPQQRVAMVERISLSMITAMRGNIATSIGVDDPGLSHIFDTAMEKLPAAMRPAMERRLPELVDAMTRAYVRHFSSEDLRAILAFAQTPAGGHYMTRAADLMQDPDVLTVLASLNGDGMAVGMASAQGMKAQISAYLAQHPEVAKKIAAAHAQR